MALNFVDYARCWGTTFRLGTRFTMGKFVWTPDAQKEDEEGELTPEDVTFREVLAALKSVSQHLDFTTERPSDFADHWVPTLDFKIGQDHERNRFKHNFYEKPMNSKWVLPHLSAMDPTSKRQILANDLVRRMSRIDPMELSDLAVPVINRYNHKLIFSGYPYAERIRIVESGISLYHDKLDSSTKEGREFYRMGVDSLETRSRKALLEKVSWYKGPAWTGYLKGHPSPDSKDRAAQTTTPREEGEGETSTSHQPSKRAGTGKGQMQDHVSKKGKVLDVISVMFVQRTEGGKLIDALRREEHVIAERAGYRVKLVEKAGSKLTQLLTRSDPFGGQPCERMDCPPCASKSLTGKVFPCWKTNLTYKATCLRCQAGGVKAEYLGESSKSLRDRSLAHLKSLRGAHSSSFMLRHNLLHHDQDDPFRAEYAWEPITFFQKPMDRQVSEAIEIKKAYGDGTRLVLNAKTEYSRCVLPGITPQPTEEEKEQEEAVQKRIRDLRRKKGLPDKEESHDTQEVEQLATQTEQLLLDGEADEAGTAREEHQEEPHEHREPHEPETEPVDLPLQQQSAIASGNSSSSSSPQQQQQQSAPAEAGT